MSWHEQTTKQLTLGAKDVGPDDGGERESEHHVVESGVEARLQNIVGSARVREKGSTPVKRKQDTVAQQQ